MIKSKQKSLAKATILGISVGLILVSIVLWVVQFFAPMSMVRNVSLGVITLVVILLSVLVGVTWRFFGALGIINKSAEVIAAGNLNVSDILLEKTKGLENLTKAFNEMKGNFLDFIELTKGNIITLSDAIGQVTASIEVSHQGNQEISETMSDIAAMTQHQLSLVQDTIESLEISSAGMDKISGSMGQIETSIAETVAATNDGTVNMQEFYKELEGVSENLDHTNGFIGQLNEEIKKISDISGFINQVSGQLQLLGLNASIEAARAGESGKSFAIVAQQIGELSAKTQESTKEIGIIIKDVNDRSQAVNDSIGSFISNFNESKISFHKVQESFDTIAQKGEVLNQEISQINVEIGRVSEVTTQTKDKGLQLQKASDEISEKTNEVASVTQEELIRLEEIGNNTNSLNEMLVGIRQLVKRFNSSVLPVDRRTSKQRKIGFISLDKNYGFWDTVYRGALYAKKELEEFNVLVDVNGYVWDSTLEGNIKGKMREFLEEGYDAIALNGILPDMAPFVEEAAKKGIPVALFNSDFSQPSSRIGFFAPNVQESATAAARLMKKGNSQGGKIILAIPKVGYENKVYQTRQSAIEHEIKKNKKFQIVHLEVEDSDKGVGSSIKKYLETNPDVKGIFVIGQGLLGAAKSIEEIKLENKVKVVGFDHSKEIFEAIKRGSIYVAIGQDPFGQGHDPIVWLYNHVEAGVKFPSEAMWSRLEIVDKTNVI